MHGCLNWTLAALLAFSAGGAAADAKPAAVNGKDGKTGSNQALKERPERRRHDSRTPAMQTGRNHDNVPALFRELSPHRAAKLEKLRKDNPERFRGILRHLARKMRELDRMRRQDAEGFNRHTSIMRLEDKAARIADRLRALEDAAEKAQLKQELSADLEELFDKKEEAQRARLRRMERDLQELKERLDERRRNRTELIEKRLKELTGPESEEF